MISPATSISSNQYANQTKYYTLAPAEQNYGKIPSQLCNLPQQQPQIQGRPSIRRKTLAWMRMGIDTKADQKAINSCADDNHNVHLPTDPNICYACPTNKERNAVTASMFKQHILATHPTIDSDELPPDNTLIILEASVRRKKQKVSCGLHGTIVTMLGGADIRVTNYNSRGAKIDPVLRLFPGLHHMCMTKTMI